VAGITFLREDRPDLFLEETNAILRRGEFGAGRGDPKTSGN
jgi:hypothetical protein